MVLLPFKRPALHQSSCNCCHCAINIESYSSLEYYFNSVFPLKVQQVVLVFCHLAGLVWATEATLTLSDAAFLSRRQLLHKNPSHICGDDPFCCDCCGQCVTPEAIQQVLNFEPGSSPWYPHSLRFPRMICYFTCHATYFSQFHAFFSLLYINVCNAKSASNPVALTWFGPGHLWWMA